MTFVVPPPSTLLFLVIILLFQYWNSANEIMALFDLKFVDIVLTSVPSVCHKHKRDWILHIDVKESITTFPYGAITSLSFDENSSKPKSRLVW